jgi:hypothetical protein
MTPTTTKRPKRTAAAALGLSAFLAAFPADSSAKRFEKPPWMGSLTVGGGIFYATQGDLRALYGDIAGPIHAQLDFRIGGPFAVFAGLRSLHDRGRAAIFGPAFDGAGDELKLVVRSLRAGVRVDSSLGGARIFGQLGAAWNAYRETWAAASLEADGSFPGIVLAAGGEISLSGPWALQLRLEYASLPTNEGGYLEPDIDLGGVDAVLGIVFRFGRR